MLRWKKNKKKEKTSWQKEGKRKYTIREGASAGGSLGLDLAGVSLRYYLALCSLGFGKVTQKKNASGGRESFEKGMSLVQVQEACTGEKFIGGAERRPLVVKK